MAADLDEDEQETLFEPAIGGMGRQASIDATWRFESAAVLAWALELLPLPPHDETVSVDASIARERHQAGNRLVGDHAEARYTDVRTDTDSPAARSRTATGLNRRPRCPIVPPPCLLIS
jgi:hypothetical protein